MTQLGPDEKQWLGVKVADGSIHVFPSNDLVDHLPTEDCICGPSLDPVPEPPLVHFQHNTDSGLNSDQCRELAAVLLEAAAELDRWAR
jgi:hypothetical protein